MGGIPNTQEVINLCDEHKIYPDTQVVPVSEINKVYELLDKGNDAGIRYVLDLAGSLTEQQFDSIDCGAKPQFGEQAPQLRPGKIVGEFNKMFSRFILRVWIP